MEKLDKLSDYPRRGLFWYESDAEEAFMTTTAIVAVFGFLLYGTAFLVCLDEGKPFELSAFGWLFTATIVLCAAYWVFRFVRVRNQNKKRSALEKQYEKEKNKVKMLDEFEYEWYSYSENYYDKLYNYLMPCLVKRYEDGKIEKYYYIDELFFGKVESYLKLKETINGSTMTKETEEKYAEIKVILDKSAEKYWHNIQNFKKSQTETMVDVVLNVFKEVEI